jgi:magnesium transporter
MTPQEKADFTERLQSALNAPPEEDATQLLVETLESEHPADIAQGIEQLDPDEAFAVFQALDDTRAAEVLDELPSTLSRYITENESPGRIASLLDRLPMDDAAEVVAEATPEQAEMLLAELTVLAPEDAAEVRELLSYDEGTAGRLMTDKFLRLGAEMTVAEAFAIIRRSDPEIETLTDLYITERFASRDRETKERLTGLLSLRHLARADPHQKVGDIMVRQPVTVSVDTDQQEVAHIISKYDFLALPVLDREGYLAGIITVDDVIDVLVEEFNEDYMKLIGSDAEEMDRRTPFQVAQLRLPWLFGTMLIELFAGGVISKFDYVLKEIILLASFMPVISAISGNVGLQAAAIIVRGLDTGHVSLKNSWRAISKEVTTALLMALACGLALGGVGAIWSRHPFFGLVIGVAMTCSIMTASFMGTAIPMVSKRLGFDPATTAGPFETAFQDVVGFAVFLWLASLLLPFLK